MPVRTSRFMSHIAGAFAAIAAFTIAAPASADPAQHPPQHQDAGHAPRDGAQLLRGPDVENSAPAPGRAPMFSDPADGAPDIQRREQPVPHRVFIGAFMALQGDDAPPELAPTDEQKQSLRALERGFRAERRAFHEKNGERLRELRRRVNPDDVEGRRGPPDGGPDRTPRPRLESDREQARAAIEEMRSLAPDPAGVHQKVWEALTDAQRAFVREKIEAFRAERYEKRMRNIIRDRMKKAPDPEARREEMRKRLRQMTPEQRRQFRERMRQRRQLDRSAPRRDAKPAPEMDDLKIPD